MSYLDDLRHRKLMALCDAIESTTALRRAKRKLDVGPDEIRRLEEKKREAVVRHVFLKAQLAQAESSQLV